MQSQDSPIRINDAAVVEPNLRASNGIVHGIDRVLMAGNESKFREAATSLEEGVKRGAEKAYDGLKSGARKIEKALD